MAPFEKGNQFGKANKGAKHPYASEFWKKWNAENHELTDAQRQARRSNVRFAQMARSGAAPHCIMEIDEQTKIGRCRKCGMVPLKTANHNSKSRKGIQWICWVGSISRQGGPPIHVSFPDQALKLWESQKGKCAICIQDMTLGGREFNSATLDHCHQTGVIRAWLCQSCNKGLGHFYENLTIVRSALMYLETKCNLKFLEEKI